MSALGALTLFLLVLPVLRAHRRRTSPAFSRLPPVTTAAGARRPEARKLLTTAGSRRAAGAYPAHGTGCVPSTSAPAAPGLRPHPAAAGSAPRRWSHGPFGWRSRRPVPRDSGMATAEYALMLVVACGFAVVLFGVLHSTAVRDLLAGVVRRALSQSI